MTSSELFSASELKNRPAARDTIGIGPGTGTDTGNGTGNIFEGTPEWLTSDYLKSCMRSYYKDAELKLDRVIARPALGKGENYGGVLSRVKVEYTTGAGMAATGSYIVKTSFESDALAAATMKPYDIFNCEMSIYQNVLPKLKALLLSIGDTEQIYADTMAVDVQRSALIFEDLNVRGYVMPDRLTGVDMDVAKIVLRKVAKMHAASAVLNEREGGCLERFNRGLFNRHTDNYAHFFLGLLDACSELVSQWEGYQESGKKLKALTPVYMELGKRVFDATAGHLNVLVHGDLWTNNVLVKYDQATGALDDVIIIDFQYSAWGSPAIDILYFFKTSLCEEGLFGCNDELIQYYYYILADTLKRLAYQAQVPSLHCFRLQLQEKEFYALNSTCIVLPVMRNIHTEDADFNALMQADERARNFKRKCYQNDLCQRVLRHMLPIYMRRGLLDANQ